MKRSQMIEQIYDLLNCDGVLEHSMPQIEPVKLTEEHIRNIAKWMLEVVEDNGMFPPFVGENYKKQPSKVFISIITEENIYSGTSHWEEENE